MVHGAQAQDFNDHWKCKDGNCNIIPLKMFILDRELQDNF